VIVKFAGKEVGSYQDMVKLLQRKKPGDEVELEVDGLGVLANRVGTASAAPFAPDPDRVRPRLGQ
jgi:hypothetical protein